MPKRRRFRLVLVAIAAALTTTSGAAQAAPTYSVDTVLGASGATDPARIVVEEATGNHLVTDPDSGDVLIGTSSGSPLGGFSRPGGAEPSGIAIDQATGDVYVADAGRDVIERFISDGAPTPTYTLDASFTSPAAGSGPGEVGDFAAALAWDSAAHELLVADPGNARVSRFSATGAFVSSFTGSDTTLGAFSQPLDVAVDDTTGDIYVVDLPAPGHLDAATGAVVGTARVERFSSAGTALGELDAGWLYNARAVAVDRQAGTVVVVTQGAGGNPSWLRVYRAGLWLTEVALPSGGSVTASLAADGTTGRLYALTAQSPDGNTGADGVVALAPATLPDLTLGAVDQITSDSAHVTGTVDPLGLATAYGFQWSPDGTSWTAEPTTSGVMTPTSVEGTLTGLEPSTQYRVRLAASNANGFTRTPASMTFTTAAAPVVPPDDEPTPPTTTPGAPAQATAPVPAPVTAPLARYPITALHATFRGTRLQLRVTVARAGQLRVTGAKLVTARRDATGPATLTFSTPLTTRQAALRRRGRVVRVPFTVTFTPREGVADVRQRLRTTRR
jgi:hypothetical protein